MKERLSRRKFLQRLALTGAAAKLSKGALGAGMSFKRRPDFDVARKQFSAGYVKSARPDVTLDEWLTAHPNVRDSIIWQFPRLASYQFWSAEKKGALHAAFDHAMAGTPTGLTDPPPNAIQSANDDDLAYTALQESYAWPLYVTYVANSLAIEIARRVPWSIVNYSKESLSILFDSREMFRWSSQYNAYQIDPDSIGLMSVPAPPDVTLSFLLRGYRSVPILGVELAAKFQKLPFSDPRATIVHLFDWCRNNLYHYPGMPVPSNMQSHWDYRGWPPVSRVIKGKPSDYNPSKIMHWTAGCHGTVAFLRSVLRVVNIPVALLNNCSHAAAHFPTINQYIEHGDDLLERAYPPETALPYPSDKFFLDPATYNARFGSNVSDDLKCKNVDRRWAELSIQYLPVRLLSTYCKDKAANLSYANGQVYKGLSTWYTLQQLESQNLWGRMETKLASLGGCNVIPAI